MPPKVEIKQKYTQKTLPFKSYPKYVDLPYLNAALKNLVTGTVFPIVHEFLLDTGASISIINKKCEYLTTNLDPIDSIWIQYGGGNSRFCPVYETGIIIKGIEFKIPVAYDDKCEFLLLGHFGFLEYNTYTLFDSILKFAKIIRI